MDIKPNAVPIVPALDLDASQSFYERLGFALTSDYPHQGYRILHSDDGSSVHLTWVPQGAIDPTTTAHGIYLYSAKVAQLAPACGVVAEHKPWGLTEFAVSDPGGTLVRVGWPSDALP